MNKTNSTTPVIILSVVAIAASLLSSCTPTATLPPAETDVPTAVLPTTTPDPCAPENIESTIVEFDKLSREFSDSFVLAQNTPAAQLSPTIAAMQNIRRRAEDFTVPSCLFKLKEYQLGFMNTAINTSLLLYSSFSGDPSQTLNQEQVNTIVGQVNQLMAQANDFGNKYTTEMARLMGITLTPPPTMDPNILLTLTPGAPTAAP
ncbi:MAG: hypothetical protein WCC12_22980 [Anaerolineales bacterium]